MGVYHVGVTARTYNGSVLDQLGGQLLHVGVPHTKGVHQPINTINRFFTSNLLKIYKCLIYYKAGYLSCVAI